jgi:hypothetical protein
MNLDKKQLKEFLSFIKKIINFKGNEWMKDDLLDMLDLTEARSEERIEGKKIDDIHKYMKLDVDQTVIDYSLFPDDMRITLERDCLEMQKWRHGKMDVDNKFGFDIVFKEYAKCVQFQVEELFYYYFNNNFKTEESKLILLEILNKKRKSNYQYYLEIYNKEGGHEPKLYHLDEIAKMNMNDKFNYFIYHKKIVECDLLKTANQVRNESVHRGQKQHKAKVESFINKSDFHELLNSLVKLKDTIENEVILDA